MIQVGRGPSWVVKTAWQQGSGSVRGAGEGQVHGQRVWERVRVMGGRGEGSLPARLACCRSSRWPLGRPPGGTSRPEHGDRVLQSGGPLWGSWKALLAVGAWQRIRLARTRQVAQSSLVCPGFSPSAHSWPAQADHQAHLVAWSEPGLQVRVLHLGAAPEDSPAKSPPSLNLGQYKATSCWSHKPETRYDGAEHRSSIKSAGTDHPDP